MGHLSDAAARGKDRAHPRVGAACRTTQPWRIGGRTALDAASPCSDHLRTYEERPGMSDVLSDTLVGFHVEDHVGFLLRRAHQRHVAVFTAAMAHVDVTPTQFTALLKTVQAGRVTQNLLGRQAAMDPATIQGVV